MPFLPASVLRAAARPLLVPSVVDVFFCALLLAAFVRPAGLQGLLADGDTGWHIRTGELVLATGRVPVTDPFSFTRPGQAWFAWEWLSDVAFALLWRWKGVAAVAAFCGAVIALAAAVLFGRLLERGAGLAIALGATMAAVSACERPLSGATPCFLDPVLRRSIVGPGARSCASGRDALAAGSAHGVVGQPARRLHRLVRHPGSAGGGLGCRTIGATDAPL